VREPSPWRKKPGFESKNVFFFIDRNATPSDNAFLENTSKRVFPSDKIKNRILNLTAASVISA
jgi:hypothetical protein